MNNYLFRGKNAETKEWVYGLYIELEDYNIGGHFAMSNHIDKTIDTIEAEDTKPYIVEYTQKQHPSISPGNPMCVINVCYYPIIPETVGQYSGIDDILGIKVFEGDRVTGEDRVACEAYNIYGTQIEGVLTVVFEDGAFWVTGKTKYDRIGYCLLCNVGNIKVVGNIHDEES